MYTEFLGWPHLFSSRGCAVNRKILADILNLTGKIHWMVFEVIWDESVGKITRTNREISKKKPLMSSIFAMYFTKKIGRFLNDKF